MYSTHGFLAVVCTAEWLGATRRETCCLTVGTKVGTLSEDALRPWENLGQLARARRIRGIEMAEKLRVASVTPAAWSLTPRLTGDDYRYLIDIDLFSLFYFLKHRRASSVQCNRMPIPRLRGCKPGAKTGGVLWRNGKPMLCHHHSLASLKYHSQSVK